MLCEWVHLTKYVLSQIFEQFFTNIQQNLRGSGSLKPITITINYYHLFLFLFFTKITQIHSYNTRLAAKQSYYLPKARTNYGIFNIRFQGPSVWNSIDEDIKSSSLSLFKKKMKQHLIKDFAILR